MTLMSSISKLTTSVDQLTGEANVTKAQLEAMVALADAEVVEALGEDGINEKFDMGYHTKHVDTIFRRVFGE